MRYYLLLLLFPVLLLTACSGREPHYTVGVSQCLDDAWREKMNQEMERELLLHPEITLSRRVAFGSSELQCAQIDSFIAEHVDLLIVSPNEADEVSPAVSRAYNAGIPVIVADRRVKGDEWTAFIGGDNVRVGELMGTWIQSVVESSKKSPIYVLEVCGLPGSTPATLRQRGMMDYLRNLGDRVVVESVVANWQKDEAYEVVRGYLREHKPVDVIVAQNDLMAVGAAEAIRDSRYPYSHVRIMGVDGISLGLQAVSDDVIECTATYSSRGDMVIETAVRILAGEPYVRDTVLETTLIDKEAARGMLIQYRERMHDLETLRIVQTRSDAMWRHMQTQSNTLAILLFVVCVVFSLAMIYLSWMHRGLQTEIREEVVPQLVDVQEAIQLSKRDEMFSERMRRIVDEHLSDANLNVEFLSSELQLSRTQMFRRVKTITGKGPLEYIRERRLIRADELLRTTDMTVQQVALEMCFSSAGYFTKCYKEFFGHLPSER